MSYMDHLTLCIQYEAHAQSLAYRAYGLQIGSESLLQWAWRRFTSVGIEEVVLLGGDFCGTPNLEAALRGTSIKVLSRGGTTLMSTIASVAKTCHSSHLAVMNLEALILPPDLLLSMPRECDSKELDFAKFLTESEARCSIFSCPLVGNLATLEDSAGFTDPELAANSLREWSRKHASELPFRFNHIAVDLRAIYGWESGTMPRSVDFSNPQVSRAIAASLQAAGPFTLEQERAGMLVRAIRATLISERARAKSSVPHVKPSSTLRAKRVLFISGPSAFSGAEMSMCTLCAALRRLGWDVHALIALEGYYAQTLRASGVKVICPDMDISVSRSEVFRLVLEAIRTTKPDVIHLNGGESESVRFAVASIGVPIVQHVRIEDPAYMADALSFCDAIIAITTFVKDRVLTFDIEFSKISVICDEVDTHFFDRSLTPAGDSRNRLDLAGHRIILMIARVIARKRIDVAIRSLPEVLLRFPDVMLVVVTGGFCDVAVMTELDSLADALGVASHTKWLGFESDVRSLFAVADCFVLCAEEEALGRSVAEAMSMEVPVIVCDSGGTPELVRLGGGLIVPPGDPSALSKAISEVLEDRTLSRSLGTQGRTVVKATCDADEAARRVSHLYHELLNQQVYL